MRVVADRLSLRWYLGYDLTEPLPDHSSLTRIRERYGLEVFRRFFEAIVEQCVAAGLVWGKELYIDSTEVAANAAHRLAPTALCRRGAPRPALRRSGADDGDDDDGATPRMARSPAPTPLPVALTDGGPRRAGRARRRPPRLDRGGRAARPHADERRLPAHRRLPGQHDRPRCVAAAADGRRRRPRLPRPLRRRRRQGADHPDRAW